MFDLGWSKLLIIAVVAIVVVGPQELPALLRTLGRFVSQLRRQANEFRAQFEDMLKDTELQSIRKDLQDIKQTTVDAAQSLQRSVDDGLQPVKEFGDALEQSKPGEQSNAGTQPVAVPTPDQPRTAEPAAGDAGTFVETLPAGYGEPGPASGGDHVNTATIHDIADHAASMHGMSHATHSGGSDEPVELKTAGAKTVSKTGA